MTRELMRNQELFGASVNVTMTMALPSSATSVLYGNTVRALACRILACPTSISVSNVILVPSTLIMRARINNTAYKRRHVKRKRLVMLLLLLRCSSQLRKLHGMLLSRDHRRSPPSAGVARASVRLPSALYLMLTCQSPLTCQHLGMLGASLEVAKKPEVA